MEKGDHPELDDSELLDAEGIQQYQSLIGSLQWAISFTRFDISTVFGGVLDSPMSIFTQLGI